MMDKTFDPGAVEDRVARTWDDAQAFRAGRPERADAPPFSIVIPPPNVTGSLHMGHALNNTLQDILARFERMRGKDVLWQPGTDHAGIATQMVVERQLAERQQPGRRDMGREAFLARVWEWKAESGGTIVNQLKRLGASCDWSRERFTMDEGLSKAVVKVFVELHRQGLIYKDKRLVNWDPKLLTAVSDIEVVQVETKGNLWHFNYPVEDAIYDPENPLTFITVATTRPETMLGDTAVAVHPDNVKLGHFIGRRVVLPLVGRTIPVVADTYADPEKGTGAVKITPAHDFNDFEVGRRHDLPLINIFDQEAKLTLRDNADFLEGVPESADLDAVLALDGKDRFEARKLIVAMMQERNLCPAIEPNAHTVPHGDRSNVVIEPWLTDQWYVDAKTLAQPAIAAVRDGRTQFVPKNWEKTFFEWLENIQPWCISRQLWWGHQIPAWYSAWGGVYVAETEEEAVTQALADAVTREVYDDVEAGRIAQDPDQWKTLLTRDEDVLDTWFSSALWPFSTLGWPGEDETFAKRFYPTSVLVTGFDIIFFWVARMMMMGLHFMGEIPFRDVYMHALVRDEKGAKMSKSKGNVIDPLNLIDTYGADALRFTLAAMAAQGRDIKLATQRVEGYRNFATKLWNASRFAEMNGCARVAGFDPATVQETLNKWIIGELARATGEVTTAIESYRFNEAAAAVYRFVWNIFCDWYLELGKPVLQADDDSAAKTETRATTAYVIDEIAKLLHPFMPFITEELWAIKGAEGPKRESVLALAAWPTNVTAGDDAAEAEIGFVVDLVSEVRSVRAEMNVPAGAQMPLVLTGADAEVRRRAGAWDAMIKRLARLSDISFADAPPPESAQMIVRGVVAALPLAGVVDLAAEKVRLTKEIAKEEGEVRRVDGKLNNADFVRRAPEEVVEENRERREEALSRIAKLKAALERLQ
ncbi:MULTISPECIES: valine--tRNA ligase [unclassified Beijerinckia]|uniref:valine--tRNA ligase n=1 Tax=unclassified Beijerinckia TaxID=2638183 RepID=UPI00089755B3|nr:MULTISPECIES: valine--tRNA ligase [unclassified Beijerinckia]MDH7795257.1 valyl-tRNA synthetase [Beijerinckia sp. GAS462]SEB94000.1 valyl-tRNA synthetase [Beijerinckia sp. 28-YEA-48]